MYFLREGVGKEVPLCSCSLNIIHTVAFLTDFFFLKVVVNVNGSYVVVLQCAGWGWGVEEALHIPHPTSLSQADSCQESRAEA